MSVYRRPFDYSAHYAARVEWQPQPSWEFDGVTAFLIYTAGVGTLTGEVNLYGTSTAVRYSTAAGTVSIPHIVSGVTYTVAYRTTPGVVTSEALTIPVAGINATLRQPQITARFSQSSINAQLAQNSISARLQ